MDNFPNWTNINIDFFSIDWAFKLLFFVLVFGYVFYSFLLSFRVKILADTIQTTLNKTVVFFTTIHLICVVVGSLVSLIVILLA